MTIANFQPKIDDVDPEREQKRPADRKELRAQQQQKFEFQHEGQQRGGQRRRCRLGRACEPAWALLRARRRTRAGAGIPRSVLQPRLVATIVIVGGGFAGVAVARRLEHRLRPGEAEIVLISRENYSLFTPMLPEVTSGELEVRHVVTPIRAQLRRTQFILADVDEFDIERRTVTYHHVLTGKRTYSTTIKLVLALGSSTSTFGLPGIAENTWALKTLDDADALRNHLVMLLELADTIDDARCASGY